MPTLTSNPDTPQTVPGTNGDDTFRAPVFTTQLGIQSNTLQSFDSLNGLAGNDTLEADISTGGSLSDTYNVRPELRSIENVELSAVDAGDDGLVTLDLGDSVGVKRVDSVDSNADVRINNARSTTTFGLINYSGDDDYGLDVRGVTSNNITVDVENTAAGSVYLSRLTGADFVNTIINIADSQIALDAETNSLKVASTGSSDEGNLIEIYGQQFDGEDFYASYNNVKVSGDARLTFTGEDLDIEHDFDASASTGGVNVDQDIIGDAVLVRGSRVADNFEGIDSSRSLRVDLGEGNDTAGNLAFTLGDDSVGFGGVHSNGRLTLYARGGNDTVVVDGLTNNLNNRVEMGSGNDSLTINGVVSDDGNSSVDLITGLDDTSPYDILLGGDGSDTLTLTLDGEFGVAALNRSIDAFETLVLADDSNATVSLRGLEDVTTAIVAGKSDFVTFDTVTNGKTIVSEGDSNDIDVVANGTTDLASVKLAVGIDPDAPGTPDADLNGEAVTGTVFTVEGFNAVNLESRGDDTPQDVAGGVITPDANTVTITADDSETLNISGSEDIRVSSAVNAFTVVNGSAATGDIDLLGGTADGEFVDDSADEDFNGIVYAGAVTITDGAGDDRLVGGDFGDTFNLSKGGQDRVYILTNEQSDSLAIGELDTVTSFDVAGNDTLVFNANATDGLFDVRLESVLTAAQNASARDQGIAVPNGDSNLVFLGNAINADQAKATLAAFDAADTTDAGDRGAIFSQGVLYVDTNGDGQIVDNVDTVIGITGKSALNVNDLNLAYIDAGGLLG